MNENQIRELERHTGWAERYWLSKIIIPYSNNYEVAYSTFHSTLKNEHDSRKKAVDFMFSALALTGGTFLSAAVANALKTHVSDRVLRGLLETRIARSWLSEKQQHNLSQSLSSFIGALGDKVTDKSISSFKDNLVGQATSAAQGVKSAFRIRNDLEKFIADSRLALKKRVNEEYALCLSSRNETAWHEVIESVVNSPFMCPPKEDIFQNDPTLTERIELSFYLTIIIDADYLKGKGPTPGASINMSPNNSFHPSRFNNPNNYSCNTRNPVGYRDTDSFITDRIMKLAKSLHSYRVLPRESIENPIEPTSKTGGRHFNELMIVRAEKMMKQIGAQSDTIFRKQRPIVSVDDIMRVG